MAEVGVDITIKKSKNICENIDLDFLLLQFVAMPMKPVLYFLEMQK
jgi:hypothetical protein